MMGKLATLAVPWAVTAIAGCTTTTYLQSPPIPAEHTITVDGSASMDVLPDEAFVELTIVAHDTSMLAAHAALMSNNSALLAELRQRPGLVVEQGTLDYAPGYEAGHLARYAASTQTAARAPRLRRAITSSAARWTARRTRLLRPDRSRSPRA